MNIQLPSHYQTDNSRQPALYYNKPLMSPYQPSYMHNNYSQNNYIERELLQRDHKALLENIKNKVSFTSILCSKNCTWYSWLRTIVNIPLILSSGAMTILNSMNDTNSQEIKYANIVLNSCTVTILSLIGNFKLAEREINYRQTQVKMDRLYHRIEDTLRIDPNNRTIEDIRDIIKEYVNIYEHLDYPIFPIYDNNKTPSKNNIKEQVIDPKLTLVDNMTHII
jgi:hypothetical protein